MESTCCHCAICHCSINYDLKYRCVANSNYPNRDHPQFEVRNMCRQCQSVLQLIEKYVKIQGLKYMRKQKDEENNKERNQLSERYGYYSQQLMMQIRLNRLNHLACLPLPLQYMILLAMGSQEIYIEQIHFKIKHIILKTASKYSIQASQLYYMVMLIHIMLCHQPFQQVQNMLETLAKAVIQKVISWNSLLTGQNINQDNEKPKSKVYSHSFGVQNSDHQSFKKNKLNKTFVSITNEHTPRRKITRSRINKERPEIAQVHYTLVMNRVYQVLKGFRVSDRIWQLVELEYFRNNYRMLLMALQKDQQNFMKSIQEMENRHNKEKDQYLNKIVTLTNRIEFIEKQLKGKEITSSEKEHTQKGNNHKETTFELQDNQEYLRNSLKSPQSPSIQQNQTPIVSCFQNSTYLQSILILTDLLNYNQSKTSLQGLSESDLCTLIVCEVQSLILHNTNLLKKYNAKSQDLDSMMEIIEHKEQRLLKSIQGKDDQIQQYQSALLQLETSQKVDGPLAPRINYIMQKYSKNKMDPKKNKSKQLPINPDISQSAQAQKKVCIIF